VVVRFVDIGGIVDHHCLMFPCFVDIIPTGIANYNVKLLHL
jgi:hypothetical protein